MTAREIAFKILLDFEKSKDRLDDLISLKLKDQSLINKERKFVYNLCSGVIRNKNLFDWKLSSLFIGDYKKTLNKFKTILRLALYEIDSLDYIPPHATVNEYVNLAKSKLDSRNTSTVNALLRTYLREGMNLDPAKKFKYIDTIISIKYSFPEWLVKRWINFWGDKETIELCQTFNERPRFDLRINKVKISEDNFIDILTKNQIGYERSIYYNQVIKVIDIQKIVNLNLFDKGYCSVQDESALLAVELLNIQTGETILDACAAPGGKYTGILESKSGNISLIGLDNKLERLKVVKYNCIRLDLKSCKIILGDAILPPLKPRFSKILVDAPCSGLGTIQKHPDIKWRRTFDELREFQNLQLKILNSIAHLLKPGGEMVYSTCTIDPFENELVIEKFLETRKGIFEIIPPPKKLIEFTSHDYVHTFPHKHKMDGSFAVKIRKN
jgi:16S rRNA (cytosine967-C5)-methyltransferase